MAGFREVLAIEWDAHAVECFKLNFPEVPIFHGDIAKLGVEEALALSGMKSGELDVLDGSPPCQGFSTAGKRVFNDPRNSLFREYARLLRGMKPKAFVMENVSGMVKGSMKLIFATILRELKSSGYRVSCRLLDASLLGVPQSRQRVIFVGVREDLNLEPEHPLPGECPIGRNGELLLNEQQRHAEPLGALHGIPHIQATRSQANNPFINGQNPVATIRKAGSDYQALCSFGNAQGVTEGTQWVQNPQGGMIRTTEKPSVTLTARANYHAVKLPVSAALPGKTKFAHFYWSNTQEEDEPGRTICKGGLGGGGNAQAAVARSSIPDSDPALTFLPAPPLTGRVLEDARRLLQGQNASQLARSKGKGFSSYKLNSKKPAPTLYKEGALFGHYPLTYHPTEIRGLSIGEARRLCSFPDEFQLTGKWAEAWARLGNSVPPLMMRAIALRVKSVLERAKLFEP
jgi:site-specific DNA-cytosine methylase